MVGQLPGVTSTDLAELTAARRRIAELETELEIHRRATGQAILVLRWFLDGTRMRQLACDTAISDSTGYDYLHEGIDVLTARSPSLHGALLAAKAAGHDHVTIDGILVETHPRPTTTQQGPQQPASHR